ncbi:MAG: CpaE family protein [Dehalococcoidia bacterium]
MTSDTPSSVRVLLATADRALEARLVAGLSTEGIAVVARALDGPSVLDQALSTDAPVAGSSGNPAVDVVVLSAALHGLSETTLLALRGRGVPVLLLAAGEGEARRVAGLAPSVLASAPASAIAEAIRRTRDGSATGVALEEPAGTAAATDETDGATRDAAGAVIAVTSGKGAPGKSTVAIALAAALGGAGYRVALVDADLRGGNVAPYLDLDPRRGLLGLATATGPLGARLDSELQHAAGCAVLAGIERSELAAAVAPDVVTAAIALLRTRYERVVVDLASSAPRDLVLGADLALLVTGADMVSLWNARLALRSLGADAAQRCHAVINRREGRAHYDGHEVEEALRIPVAGVVREERAAARAAIERQEPLLAAGGRVAADLQALAATVDGVLTGDAIPTRGPAPRALAVEV